MLALSLAFTVAPANPAELSEPLVGLSSFARCYKFAVRQANKIEETRARRAAQVCDGKSLDEAAARANLRINSVIRHVNRRISFFAGTGPAACDPEVFDGDPLPPFPLPAEEVGATRELLAQAVQNCDGGGGQP